MNVERVGAYLWRIPQDVGAGMRVPALVVADDVLMAQIRSEALSRRSQLPPWQEWSADALAVFLAAIDLEDETTASASLEAAGVSS